VGPDNISLNGTMKGRKAIKSCAFLLLTLALSLALQAHQVRAAASVSVGFAVHWSPQPGPAVKSTATVVVINNDETLPIIVRSVTLALGFAKVDSGDIYITINPKDSAAACQLAVDFPDPNVMAVDSSYPYTVDIQWTEPDPLSPSFTSRGERREFDSVNYTDGANLALMIIDFYQEFPCVIVTAAYGTPLAPEVQFIKNFRDMKLFSSFTGSSFMDAFNAWYYSWSPAAAHVVAGSEALREATRAIVQPLVLNVHAADIVYSALSFNPELAATTAIVVIMAGSGILRLAPIVLLAIIIKFHKFSVKRRDVALLATAVLGSALVTVAGQALLQPAVVVAGLLALSFLAMGASAIAVAGLAYLALVRAGLLKRVR
jgi:hypothetical protein